MRFVPSFVVSTLILQLALAARAQDTASPVLEIFPPHIALRLAQREPSAQRETLALPAEDQHALEWIYLRSKQWIPGQTLRVCFIGGSAPLNAKIASAALAWTQYANLKMDFGGPQGPTNCTPLDESEVRVGYGYKGYWSLVGTDSVDFSISGRGEETLNLEGFDLSPPAPADFDRLVRHEFGHAIGFSHEHQNPDGHCDAEFDWPVLYDQLGKPPNSWSKEKVDHNLRAIADSSMIKRSTHDPKSIMHYSFPAWFFTKGAQSECYVATNFQLSDLDKTGAAEAYPKSVSVKSVDEQRAELTATIEQIPTESSAGRMVKARLNDRLKVLDAAASLNK